MKNTGKLILTALALFFTALALAACGGGGGGATSTVTGTQTQYYTLNAAVSPMNGGTITFTPNTPTYAENTVVTINVAAASGYKFKEWGGTNAVEIVANKITMNGNKSVTAIFEATTSEVPVAQKYTLTLAVSPSASAGTVTAAPAAAQYDSGTSVTLTAAPAAGYKFKNWGGANGADVSAAGVIAMNANKSVTAVFEASSSTTEVPVAQKYTLTLAVSPSATSGTVTATPAGPQYDAGTVVTLSYNAYLGNKFSKWDGTDAVSVVNDTITMSANRSVTAAFESSTAATSKSVAIDAGSDLGAFTLVMGSHNGPVSLVKGADETAKYRELGFKNIRTLDYYGPCNWYTIFPDFTKDPELESSYDFSTTDVRIKKLKDEGFEILFNFAPSWTKEVAINTLADPPGTIRNAAGVITHAADANDFKKFANIVKHIAMHYNAGWKNGYSYGIKRWEIWNEPETYNQFWNGTPMQFYQMYAEVSKTLRSYDSSYILYGPGNAETIPMNNPNALDTNTYTGSFLDYCSKNGVSIDVYTWHSYGGTSIVPSHMKTVADDIKTKLSTYGYPSAKMSCDEWNSGINASNFADSGKGAAFYGCAMTFMVEKGVSEFYQYRGDDHPLGLLNDTNGQFKTAAYALKAWKEMTESCTRIKTSTTESGEFAAIASKSSTDGSYYALVSNFTTENKTMRLALSSVPSPPANGWTVTRKVISDTQKLATAESGTIAHDASSGASYAFDVPAYTVAFVKFARN